MQQIVWMNRDGHEQVDFVSDGCADAIRAMVDADTTNEVGQAIARAMGAAITYQDEVAFDIATQASEEMGMKMGHSEEQVQTATLTLKAKHFQTA